MAKYEQGTAPAVLFNGNGVVFEFVCRKLECDNSNGLHEILVEQGAECVEGSPLGDVVKVKAVEPEGFAGLTKPEAVAHVKAIYGVDISPNQSRPDMMAKIAAIIANADAEAGAVIQAELKASGIAE